MKPFYETTEMIDVDLFADALVAIYRFNHAMAVDSIFPACIAPERTASSKRALTMASYSALTTNGWSSVLSASIGAERESGVAAVLLGGELPFV